MKALNKIYLTITMLFIGVIMIPNASYAIDAKAKLITSIEREQQEAEEQIIKLWMSGERGEKLELAMSEYVTLEVRQRALTDKIKNKTLLEAVSADQKYKPENCVDLAREIVLEYFKRKGIDFKNHRFVQGEYHILINN